jgi:non-specific protein-tyrosine kinase
MNDFIELRKYLDTLVKWWWLVVAGGLVAAGIGYVASRQQPPVYQAYTTVIVGPSTKVVATDRQEILTSQMLAATYADLVKREPVLKATAETLHLDGGWQALKSRVKASLIEGTQLLEIRVDAGSKVEAQATANEIARQLILLGPSADSQEQASGSQLFVQEQMADLQAKIVARQQQIAVLQATITPRTSAARVEEIQNQIISWQRLVDDWQRNYAALLPFEGDEKSANKIAIVESAQINDSATRPHVALNTLVMGIVGLALAAGAVLLREGLDDSLKVSDDLNHLLGVASLGTLGRMKANEYRQNLITYYEPRSNITETYRLVWSKLRLMSPDRVARSILVTSSRPGEGKSVTAANLGVVIAQAGFRTILVDADLRRPTLHRIFEIPNRTGLTDLLFSPNMEQEIEQHLTPTCQDNLMVLTTGGALPPDPTAVLISQRMKHLLNLLEDSADVVLFDSPPVLAVADANLLSSRVNGVLLVFDAGKTPRSLAKQTARNLAQVGATVLGAVLNRVDDQQTGYYYGMGHDTIGRPASTDLLKNLVYRLTPGGTTSASALFRKVFTHRIHSQASPQALKALLSTGAKPTLAEDRKSQ